MMCRYKVSKIRPGIKLLSWVRTQVNWARISRYLMWPNITSLKTGTRLRILTYPPYSPRTYLLERLYLALKGSLNLLLLTIIQTAHIHRDRLKTLSILSPHVNISRRGRKLRLRTRSGICWMCLWTRSRNSWGKVRKLINLMLITRKRVSRKSTITRKKRKITKQII